MLDHVAIGASDIAAAKRFYDAALESVGYRCLYQDTAILGYGAAETSLWLNAAERPVPPDYGPEYYAAFAIDPDGYRIEAHHEG